MILSAIVALSDNNAIGRRNELPWHLPDDLKFFKKTTLGKPVLMGRKTFASLGRPLPGRLNMVLSTQDSPDLPEGVVHCRSLAEGIIRLQQEAAEEGFIIGGGEIFRLALPLADRLYLTRVHTIVEDADVFFPEPDPQKWHIVNEEKHPADEKHAFAFTFQQLERIHR